MLNLLTKIGGSLSIVGSIAILVLHWRSGGQRNLNKRIGKFVVQVFMTPF